MTATGARVVLIAVDAEKKNARRRRRIARELEFRQREAFLLLVEIKKSRPQDRKSQRKKIPFRWCSPRLDPLAMRTARLSLRGTLVALVLSSCNAISTTPTPRTAHPTLGRPLPLPRRQLACARMCEPAMDVATGQGGSLERSDEILLRAEMMELQLRLSSLREQASSHHTHKSCVCHNSHSPIILRHLSHTPPVTRPLFLPIPDTVFF